MSAKESPTARRSGSATESPSARRSDAATESPTAQRSSAGTRALARTGAQPHLVLDRYHLTRRLGAGAFGTVWMARDERLQRDVAVKVVPRERVMHARFEREARAAARLTHPGIVTLYEAAVDDEGAYLVSELVRGPTLSLLLEAGRLSDRDVVAIALALCEALSYAHANGIVHRDVKPSNVLVPEQPASPAHPAKLTDFGVARVLGGDSLTRTGDVVGTAAYMAPEQAEGRDAGPPADLYSLALVAYEALTGVNPVRTGTAAVRARRLGAHLPPLRRQRRDLPRELGQGIDLALRPRPRERGTIDELHQTLAGTLDRVQDDPGVVGVPWPRRSHAPEPPPPFEAEVPEPQPEHDHAPFEPVPAAIVPWPQRAIAAAGAAATSAWLAAHLLGSRASLVAALITALLVVALPRIGWLTGIGGLAIAAAVRHHPGAALVLVIAMLVPVVLLPRKGTLWPLAAAAPALGLIGLAGAWPAAAARIGANAYRRAALAATGWIWLVLAAPLARIDLYTRRPRAPQEWGSSLRMTVHDVLVPAISSGVVAGAAVWAIGAAALPWLLRGRSLKVELVLVTAWSAMLVSASEVAIALLRGANTVSTPPTAVAGALAGGVLALSPALVKAWRGSRDWADDGGQLP
jgi:eukaryotic-like serine/threonine-protein kinase